MSSERFIPFRKADVVYMCNDVLINKETADADSTANSFEVFCNLLVSRIHFQYHEQLERLKNSYALFDPNKDTRTLKDITDSERKAVQKDFASEFSTLLDSANFEKVTDTDLEDALHEESLFKVRLAVSFDDFQEVVFYRRGESVKTETLRTFFGLRKKSISFTNYDRVAVYITFKDKDYFDQRKNTKKQLPVTFIPGATIIKLFQNVPKADLEMLFPNSEVKMRPLDKLIIGASATVGGIVVLVTKLGASILLLSSFLAFWLGLKDESVELTKQSLITFGIGMGVFGSFVFKEWTKFKNRKIRFMKALSDNLYFKNLDNNAGVFHTLVDAAEEEDCKEALLAYTFLLKHEGEGMSADELDKEIEAWFEQTHHCTLDFDVSDAIDKLVKMKLVEIKPVETKRVETGLVATKLVDKNNERFTAKPLKNAIKELDEYWDNIYQG
ncbi:MULTISPECIES: TMEM143 family protein [unclassified Alteromonas]|uniref:TMEM143 family protein n=1 Tax=unclassified Alteromonas TaxID=2614992 RepID=UPI000509D417|nr:MULTISPECIES: TMEM143 family protein [unclassified Alteromonas]